MAKFPEELLQRLRQAERIAILTGAGISAESGIPTFRDAQTGFWSRMKPEDLATPEAFERNPKLVWDWYAYRREMVDQASPNAGHYALAKMAEHVPNLTLITQNVDSLHQRAGSTNVLELHGNIGRVKCSKEHVVIEPSAWLPDEEIGVPRCPRCQALLRPDIVWFGEVLPTKTFNHAKAACIQADVVFSIGTSGLVPPAATLPVTAIEHGAYGIEVNTDQTYLSDTFECCLRGASGIILPALVKAAWPE